VAVLVCEWRRRKKEKGMDIRESDSDGYENKAVGDQN